MKKEILNQNGRALGPQNEQEVLKSGFSNLASAQQKLHAHVLFVFQILLQLHNSVSPMQSQCDLSEE